MPRKRAAGRQDGILDAARDQGIFDLQVGDGMHGGRPADRRRSDLRKPDIADITGLHQGKTQGGLDPETAKHLDRRRQLKLQNPPSAATSASIRPSSVDAG
jgi:hypothetical protein